MTTAEEYRRIKADPIKYDKEKARINNYIKNRYNSDPAYRQMILERNRKAYQQKRLSKAQQNIEKSFKDN